NPKPEEKPPEPVATASLTWTAGKPIADPQFDTRSVAISPDGKKFAVTASNGLNTVVFDTSTGTKLYVVSGHCARFIGTDIYTWALSVNQFDADTGTNRQMFPGTKGAMFSVGAQISPNGKTIAGLDCGVLRLIEVATGADAVRLTGPAKQFRNSTKTGPEKQVRNTAKIVPTNEVCWSRDGKRVAGIDLIHEAVGPGRIGGL